MSADVPPTTTGTYARPSDLDLTDRADAKDDASIGELVAATTRDVSELFRKEVELAKTELREEAAQTARAAAMVAAGALVGYLALLILLLAAAWGLAEAIPLWGSLLVVGVIAAIVAAVLVQIGRDRFAQVEAAPTTIQTLQEDVRWAKQQLS